MMVYSKIQLHQTNVTTYKFLNSIAPMIIKAMKCFMFHESYALKHCNGKIRRASKDKGNGQGRGLS